MIKLKYNLPPEIHEENRKVETVSTGVVIEEAEPFEVATIIEQFHNDNLDVDVTIRVKAPKE